MHERNRIMAIPSFSLRSLAPFALAVVGAAPLPASAQGPGFGGELATRWCMGCHVIERQPRTATADGVPSFPAIAAKTDTTAASIGQYLSTAHTHMPDFSLSRSERDALVGYILSFR
jgi:mono/diheme cytochrome c family protein